MTLAAMYTRLLKFRRGAAAILVCSCSALAASFASAAVVTLTPVKDNTLFEDNVDNSNGSGVNLYSGETNFALARRALVAFDVAGSIPAGSTVTSAFLVMHVSRVGPFGPQTVALQRLLKTWGEGASDAGDPGGDGTEALPGDATWAHNIFPSQTWASPGGDFDGTASASVLVSGVGNVGWGSTARMVADVQDWLDAPAQNCGWLLQGSESQPGRASRFDSREAVAPALRPSLTITFTPPPGSGAVPDGHFVPGTELTLTRLAGGSLHLSWGASCRGTDTDYEIYRGSLGSFSSYAPLVCTTAGATSATIGPSPGASFYLVVPTDGSIEGSYGKAANGLERPPSATACRPQTIGACF